MGRFPRRARERRTTLRTIGEVGIGVLYAIGAVFHAVYTLRRSHEFYGGFASGAWLPPARWFVARAVLPNARVFTTVLILFQGAVAGLILSRGDVVPVDLVAGGGFSVLAAFASSPAGTVGTLVPAGMQFALAASH